MLGVIVSAIMVIMIGYLMVGISGYLAFPTTVEGNVLNSFVRGDVIMQVISGSRDPMHYWYTSSRPMVPFSAVLGR